MAETTKPSKPQAAKPAVTKPVVAPVATKPAVTKPAVTKVPTASPVEPSNAIPAEQPAAPVKAPRKEPAMTTETTMKPAETVAKAMEAAVPAMEKASAETVANAKEQLETLNAKLAEIMENSMKSVTEMNEFAKGNLDAMIASAKAATTGAETLTSAIVETSKKSFEEAQEALKAMTAAKTPNEAMQLQSEFAKAQFEKTVATWSHMSETMLKLSGEVFQPLSSRMAIAAESMKKSMSN